MKTIISKEIFMSKDWYGFLPEVSFDIVSVYMIGLFLMKKMFYMCFLLFAEPLFVCYM